MAVGCFAGIVNNFYRLIAFLYSLNRKGFCTLFFLYFSYDAILCVCFFLILNLRNPVIVYLNLCNLSFVWTAKFGFQ